MKKIIIALLAAAMLTGCRKELNESDNTISVKNTASQNRLPVKIKNLSMDTGDHANIPINNLFPCEYYPPGTPYSCNPDAITDDPVPVYPTIGYQNGYLSFNSLNDFVTTYDMLDSLVENFKGYDYAMGLFGGDLDKIDSLLDVRGIDESKSLRDFENKFSGFYSLRKDIETRENSFLDNGGDPGSKTNPENSHYIDDDIFRTLLNKDGVINVENVTFKIFENGVVYAILNGSNTLLNKLMHPENYGLATYSDYYSTHVCKIDTANIKLLSLPLYCEQPREALPANEMDICSGFHRYSNLGQTCKLWYRNGPAAVLYDNNKREYVSKIAVYNLLFYDAGLSKIRGYKKKINGKWKPVRTNLSASVYEQGCSLYNKIRNTKYRRFRRAVKRDVSIIPGIGSIFRGVRWMAENIISSANGNDYYRFFKTATNYGGFHGDNYCNGMYHHLEANW